MFDPEYPVDKSERGLMAREGFRSVFKRTARHRRGLISTHFEPPRLQQMRFGVCTGKFRLLRRCICSNTLKRTAKGMDGIKTIRSLHQQEGVCSGHARGDAERRGVANIGSSRVNNANVAMSGGDADAKRERGMAR